MQNVDINEINKFEVIANRWWDVNSEFKPLHQINPLRLNYIERLANGLAGKQVIDIGCGGGILSESMALRDAHVTGIDMGETPLSIAQLHSLESGVEIDYQQTTAEAMAEQNPARYDVVTCMEMLEHVPDPSAVIAACSALVKPDGHIFFSTINRNPKAFALMIVGAEYVLQMVPKGTHEYAKFIRPSELDSWGRNSDLKLEDITGMTYNPIFQSYKLGNDVDVNYLMHFTKEKAS
ncbi:MAG: bifunctional 2-polyprenyl-6-hydroxyphenol methylase/3-demethylubiquinol 3-O-methyltransferase UbiG [Leucothrix sp.]